MYARRRLGTLICPVLLGALALSCAPTAPAGAATANDPAGPVAAATPELEPEVVPTPAEGPPPRAGAPGVPQVGRPGGAPRTGGGGAIGGAPRGVLLIEAGGEWRPWLDRQNRECTRAGAGSGCLRIVYDPVGYDPNDPRNYNCSVKVNTPSGAERRDGKIYVRPGTTVVTEATCERSESPSPSSATTSSSRRPTGSSSSRPSPHTSSPHTSSPSSGTNR